MSPMLKPYACQFGPNLLPNGAQVGAKSEPIGLGALLAEVDPKSGQCLQPYRIEKVHLDIFGRFGTDLQSV